MNGRPCLTELGTPRTFPRRAPCATTCVCSACCSTTSASSGCAWPSGAPWQGSLPSEWIIWRPTWLVKRLVSKVVCTPKTVFYVCFRYTLHHGVHAGVGMGRDISRLRRRPLPRGGLRARGTTRRVYLSPFLKTCNALQKSSSNKIK